MPITPESLLIESENLALEQSAKPMNTRVRTWAPVAVLCLLIVSIEYRSRVDALGGSSLYEDDAWVALSYKAPNVGALWQMSITSPGFVGLISSFLRIFGFSSTNAMLPAFFFGLLGGPLFLVAAVRQRFRLAAALLGAALIISSPLIVTYSTRVKQYTLETVLGIVVLSLALYLLEKPASVKRWLTLVIACLISVMFSAILTGIVVSALAACGIRFVVDVGPREALRSRVLPIIGGTAIILLGWFLILIPNVSPLLNKWWAGQAFANTGVVRPLDQLWPLTQRMFAQLFTVPGDTILKGFLVAIVALAVKRRYHLMLFVGPVVFAYLLQLSGRAPIGGGRTDIWLIAPIAMALVSGADQILEWLASIRHVHYRLTAIDRQIRADLSTPLSAVFVLLAALLGTRIPSAETFYVYDVRPLVATYEQQRKPGDTVVVASRLGYGFALYADSSIDVDRARYRIEGYDLRLADPAVMLWGSYPDLARLGNLISNPYPLSLGSSQPPPDTTALVNELNRRASSSNSVWLLNNDDTKDQVSGLFALTMKLNGFHLEAVARAWGCWLEHWVR